MLPGANAILQKPCAFYNRNVVVINSNTPWLQNFSNICMNKCPLHSSPLFKNTLPKAFRQEKWTAILIVIYSSFHVNFHEKYVNCLSKAEIISAKNTYPCTNPNPTEHVTGYKHVIVSEHCCYTISDTEDNQQSTNKNMCNGENSDPRDHCLRYCHFEAKTFPYGGNPMLPYNEVTSSSV